MLQLITTVVILGATLIDGSGRPPIRNSAVVIKGDSIVAVGRRGQIKVPANSRVIDARGLVLAPGFIDAHNHSDRGFTTDPSAASQVSQGITTVIIGQDGGSPFPVGEYLATFDKTPISLNVLTFVGHATLRERAMGDDTNRRATPAELERMSTADQRNGIIHHLTGSYALFLSVLASAGLVSAS